jgi:outer membrane biosynthesis protein TonB
VATLDGGSDGTNSETASDDAGVASADASAAIADGGATPGLGLSPEQVRAVVMASQGAFQSCYEIALARDPDAKGGITIGFQIWTDGRVARADVTSSSLGNPHVERCMVEAFKKLRFPVAQKQTGAMFPFVFKKR